MAELQIVENDGIKYELHVVKSGGRQVGLAPVKLTKDLDEDLTILTPDQVHDYATRQRREDAKNVLRAKLNGKVSPKAILEAFTVPALFAEADKAYKAGRAGDMGAAMRLVLEAQTDSPNPETIHWDCVK